MTIWLRAPSVHGMVSSLDTLGKYLTKLRSTWSFWALLGTCLRPSHLAALVDSPRYQHQHRCNPSSHRQFQSPPQWQRRQFHGHCCGTFNAEECSVQRHRPAMQLLGLCSRSPATLAMCRNPSHHPSASRRSAIVSSC